VARLLAEQGLTTILTSKEMVGPHLLRGATATRQLIQCPPRQPPKPGGSWQDILLLLAP
jgi:hypothetical protein